MHVGALFVAGGYILAASSLNLETYEKRKNSLVSMLVILVVSVTVLLSILPLFHNKLENVSAMSDVIDSVNKGAFGGSVYLVGMEITDLGSLILYAPLMMLYFFFSPMVMDWHAVSDVVAFALDSSVYIVLFYIISRTMIKGNVSRVARVLMKYLMIALMCGALVMSLGTKTAGTALRHRAKFFPMIVLVYAIRSMRKDDHEKSIEMERTAR
jgi:hypothetical protein